MSPHSKTGPGRRRKSSPTGRSITIPTHLSSRLRARYNLPNSILCTSRDPRSMAQLDIVSTKRISKTSHSQKLQVVTYGVQKLAILAFYFTNFTFSAKEEENSQKKVTIQIISSNFLWRCPLCRIGWFCTCG